jgi:S-DNA-T family DNA segregation ATPase FtsK/SpoIIIE
MAHSRKAGGKRSKTKTFIKKHPALVSGIVLCLLGIFQVIIAIAPASAGKAGRLLDKRFLSPIFGRGAALAGIYCLGVGLVLLVARAKAKCIAGLTCLFIPALVIADALLGKTTGNNTDESVVQGIYLGHVLRSTITGYIGGVGLVLVLIILLLCGIVLLTPKSVLKGLLRQLSASIRRKKPSRTTSKSTKSTVKKKPALADVQEEAIPASVEAPPQLEAQARPTELNMQLYNREFVKIPTGLFEEHVEFDTSLPVGTRRQEIIDAFAAVNVAVDIGEVRRGPSFEQYEIIPGIGVKAAQVRSRIEDVSLRLKQKVHMTKKSGGSLSIEVPLAERQTVPCGFLLESTADDTMEIPIAVGVDASFSPFSVDLVELPHLLIAGTTGSGKSVFLKTLIASIMYHLTPDEARLVLIDPKRVEFGVFSSAPFLACDIITDFEQVPPVFESLVSEMETRYGLLEEAGVSDIRRYNADAEPNLRRPYVVVVIDEFADLLMQNVEGFEDSTIRLAQKARASGIHLVLATQRPSADVIKGLLKTNIPGRIALGVSSQVDSKIILDMPGAETLTGNGDLICLCPAFRDGIRLQGAYITNEDIQKIITAKS